MKNSSKWAWTKINVKKIHERCVEEFDTKKVKASEDLIKNKIKNVERVA